MTLEELKKKIEKKDISPDEAFQLIEKMPKAWETKEWKKLRAEKIKDCCEQCGSKTPPMYLQHYKHPRSISDIKGLLKSALFEEFKKENEKLISLELSEIKVTPEEVFEYRKNNYPLRQGCPNCNKINIKERKTMTPKYKCHHCGITFEEPIMVEFISGLSGYNLSSGKVNSVDEYLHHKVYKEKYDKAYLAILETFFAKYHEQINREALITSINESIEYRGCKHTFTFCKKCAFMMDKRSSLYCPDCKIYYYYSSYSIPSKCNRCGKTNPVFKPGKDNSVQIIRNWNPKTF